MQRLCAEGRTELPAELPRYVPSHSPSEKSGNRDSLSLIYCRVLGQPPGLLAAPCASAVRPCTKPVREDHVAAYRAGPVRAHFALSTQVLGFRALGF